jgi:integrase
VASIKKLDAPNEGKARYRVRVFNGTDPRTGRKLVTTKTVLGLKEAEAEATKLEQMKSDGVLTAPTKECFSDFLVRWLDDTKKMELRARTWDDYRGIVARYIEDPPKGAPNLGALRVDRLGRGAFQQLYTYLWERCGLAPRTIGYLHSVLRQGLEHGVKVGELPRNPTDHVTLPKRPHKRQGSASDRRVRAMTEKQAKAFLNAARGDRYYPMWVVLLTGGLRPGEALGLTWDDIDLEAGEVHVRQALTRRGLPEGESWRLVQPKTKRARRTVALPGVAVQALKEWKTVTGKERFLVGGEYLTKPDFVFCNEFGKPLMQPNLYSRNFRRVMAAAKLGEWVEVKGRKNPRFAPAFRMYDLRHTCATLLLLAGENPKVVSERLGHASVILTLDTYSHVLPAMQEESARKMEAMFGTG